MISSKFILKLLIILVFASIWSNCGKDNLPPPAAVLPIPSARQLAWQDLEFYAFVHFNMNTFTNMEWGTGAEDPALFNPTMLDCRQWVQTFKSAGMKGVIITAKHHDGFCLWPSKYTDHSVKNSPWRDGDGDVIAELALACREEGLKLGIYYSPWDRNHKDYGTHDYLVYMRRQLKELLTGYGEIFEVWFDGANGGTGYYGGANEERLVDKLTYYDWENTYNLIREWQPNAVIFSDAGPDVRWVGNEDGHSYRTIWSNLMRDSVYGGMPTYHTDWADGQENGTHWVPAETNVSIRPGWYYHDYEDHKVKTLPKLIDIYYESVGMNTPLLLNFPVDQRGLVHETDVMQLHKMMGKIREDFSDDLAKSATIVAEHDRGKTFSAEKVLDGDPHTFWSTPDSILATTLTLNFDSIVHFNRLILQEYIPLGQRIKAFSIHYFSSNEWHPVARETTIGYKRILRFKDVQSDKLRITIEDGKGCPVISNLEVYYARPLLTPPRISRSKSGYVSIEVLDDQLQVFYTIDGTPPNPQSMIYPGPFQLLNPGIVQAISMDKHGAISEISRVDFDISAKDWRIINRDTATIYAIDGDQNSFWTSTAKDRNRLIIDLGKPTTIKGFTYLPPQNRWFSGIIQEYGFYASNGGPYQMVQTGEFNNIKNNPIWQTVQVPERRCRYVILKALKTLDGNPATFAEFGILTE